MYISKLFIDGFRSLKAATIQDMRPVTVFHGLNNSGKSNILAALEAIFTSKFQVDMTVVGKNQTSTRKTKQFYEGKIENFRDNFYFNKIRKINFAVSVILDDEELKPYGEVLAQIPPTAPDAKKRITLGDNHKKTCNIQGEIVYAGEAIAEMTTREVDFNGEYPIYTKGTDGKYQYLPTLKMETSKSQAFVDRFLSQMSNAVRLIPANRYLLKEVVPTGRIADTALTPQNFKQWLFNAYLGRNDFAKFEEIQKLFNSSPFEFGELGFSHEGNELEIMVKKNDFRLPINRIGSGLQQILYLVAVIVLHQGKVLAIEEIEINLSPAAQKQVFELLKKCVTATPRLLNQVFITSHSDYFDVRDDVKCFSVEYDLGKSCSEVMPWTVAWRKKHFCHDRLIGVADAGKP